MDIKSKLSFKLECLVVLLVVSILWIPTMAISEEWIIETSPTAYYPSRIRAHVGDKVTWINSDAVAHEMDFAGNPTITSEKNLYLFLPAEEMKSIVLSKPGTYPYKCSWHGMLGKIEILPMPFQN